MEQEESGAEDGDDDDEGQVLKEPPPSTSKGKPTPVGETSRKVAFINNQPDIATTI